MPLAVSWIQQVRETRAEGFSEPFRYDIEPWSAEQLFVTKRVQWIHASGAQGGDEHGH